MANGSTSVSAARAEAARSTSTRQPGSCATSSGCARPCTTISKHAGSRAGSAWPACFDLEACRFKGRLGLAGVPDHVAARLFVSDDKRTALIAVLDFRKKRTKAFALSLDTAAHGITAPMAAELVLPGGKAVALPRPTRHGHAIQVSLPADGAKLSFVRLTTGR